MYVVNPSPTGRYVHVDGLTPGDDVILTFPVFERVLNRDIAGKTYRIKLRGSNVVRIDPQGLAFPIYDRQPTGQLVKKTRFVPAIRNLVW